MFNCLIRRSYSSYDSLSCCKDLVCLSRISLVLSSYLYYKYRLNRGRYMGCLRYPYSECNPGPSTTCMLNKQGVLTSWGSNLLEVRVFLRRSFGWIEKESFLYNRNKKTCLLFSKKTGSHSMIERESSNK